MTDNQSIIMRACKRVPVHPFAKGKKQGKLPPSYPYVSGGHNQKTERQAQAMEIKAMGYPSSDPNSPRRLKGLSNRRMKKCHTKYTGNDKVRFGRVERRLIQDWVALECWHHEYVQYRNCL